MNDCVARGELCPDDSVNEESADFEDDKDPEPELELELALSTDFKSDVVLAE